MMFFRPSDVGILQRDIKSWTIFISVIPQATAGVHHSRLNRFERNQQVTWKSVVARAKESFIPLLFLLLFSCRISFLNSMCNSSAPSTFSLSSSSFSLSSSTLYDSFCHCSVVFESIAVACTQQASHTINGI